MLTIKTTKRDDKISPEKLRNEGKIPAVFYGPKEESTSVSVDAIEFKKLYNQAGESTVISVKNDADEHEALIHEIQWDVVTQEPIHIDFYVIEKGKKIEVAIPLEFIGESEAVNEGGVLVKVVHELEIQAMPKDLPQNLEVDITPLVDFETQIKAEDIKLPEGVELMVEPEEVIALVQEPKEEVEPEPEEMDLDSIEVEGEKAGEGEGAEGEASEGEAKGEAKGGEEKTEGSEE